MITSGWVTVKMSDTAQLQSPGLREAGDGRFDESLESRSLGTSLRLN